MMNIKILSLRPVILIWLLMALILHSKVDAEPLNATNMIARHVSPNVWYVQGNTALGTIENHNFISNSAFVVTANSVVVIDALGSPKLAEQLLRVIGSITPKPVSHVIVTHYHADHIYGLQTFKSIGAKIIAQYEAKNYIESQTAQLRLQASKKDLAPWVDDQTHITPADLWIDQEKNLSVGGVNFLIKHVGPAHTPEDLIVYVPSEKVLMTGDLVFTGRIPYVGQSDSKNWINALDTLLQYDVKYALPGHGQMSTDPKVDFEFTRDYLTYLRSTMSQAVESMTPFDEIYPLVDWSKFEKYPLFKNANRMNAFNTYLLLEAEQK